ncbi:Extracellular metalloprotease [Beauveria bassiana]|nr:Extracellular metalloprotease [Beauveria bassiana]
MPSISKIAATTLAVTSALLVGAPGVSAAAVRAVEQEQVNFCDWDAENELATKLARDVNQDVLDFIFNGGPPVPIEPAPPAQSAAADDGRMLEVGVYMHVVDNPEDKNLTKFLLDRSDFDRQIGVLNEKYAPVNISFHFLDADWKRHEFKDNEPSPLRHPITKELQHGDTKTLNLFWKKGNTNWGGSTLTFNKNGARTDAMYVNADTVLGGSHPVWNLGITVVHEVGHWFGLGHTSMIRPGDCEWNWQNKPGMSNEYVCLR